MRHPAQMRQGRIAPPDAQNGASPATRCTEAMAVAVAAAWRVTLLVTAVARPMRLVAVAAMANAT